MLSSPTSACIVFPYPLLVEKHRDLDVDQTFFFKVAKWTSIYWIMKSFSKTSSVFFMRRFRIRQFFYEIKCGKVSISTLLLFVLEEFFFLL
jgi:hypothetical protein